MDAQASKKPAVVVRFKGNFKGNITQEFTITAQDLGLLSATAEDKVYNKKANSWKSQISIVDLNGKKLKAGTDYEKAVSYYLDENLTTKADATNYDAGTVIWVQAQGKGGYAGSNAVASYIITKASIATAKVKVSAKSYTSQEVTLDYQDITLKVGGQELVGGKDYVIVSDSYVNNVKQGKAKVQLKGTGENYGGTKTITFKISKKTFLWRWLSDIFSI